jgi:hypothetical protein
MVLVPVHLLRSSGMFGARQLLQLLLMVVMVVVLLLSVVVIAHEGSQVKYNQSTLSRTK